MTHTLTIYGNRCRISVQSKGLNQKQASEVAAHFTKTVSQALLDAPHVGTMKEHQVVESELFGARPIAAQEPPDEIPQPKKSAIEELEQATKDIFRPRKAKKGGKKGR